MLVLWIALGSAQAMDVMHCYASSYASDTTSKLLSDGRVSSVTDYNCGGGTPTLDELLAHDAVLFYSDSSFSDRTALGNVLADYVDAGGGIVEAVFSVADNIRVEGRLLTDGYRAMETGSQTNCSGGLVSLGAHPILDGVASFEGGSSGYCASSAVAAPGADRIADWGSGEALVAAHVPSGAGTVVALNFYPPSSDIRSDFWTSSTDGATMMVNALEFALGGGGPSLVTDGSCPGDMEFRMSGLTPGGDVAVLSAAAEGSQAIPGGPCAGIASGLDRRGLGLRALLRADGAGEAVLSPRIPDSACGAVIQALDVSTCSLSNVAPL